MRTRTPILHRLAAALAAAALAPAARGEPGAPAAAPAPHVAEVRVVSDGGGLRLQADGRGLMVLGMNWDYYPVGTNYNYDLWKQPDAIIQEALAREMPLLRRMGVNAIRQYAGVPPRWVRYLYETYGIWTVVNPTIARYGYTLDGVWIPENRIDYSDPRLRAAVKRDVAALVDSFRGTPGVLMWLLGNENNYGLHWSSSEIEALPLGQRDAARARFLYSLLGEVIRDVKARDPLHPVAIANGDVQYLDLVAEECRGLDVFGANVYRGVSARDLFDVVKEKLGVPVMFTEFGADAYDARAGREDDVAQARYLVAQWREIYEQSAGKGRAGNAIGGFVFQWSDGWWKFGQESNLDRHDTNASWPNAGYPHDFVPGRNNMNEEWWGICAKGLPDDRGLYALYPRTAWYALREAWRLDPYAATTDVPTIAAHFAAIEPAALAREYRNDRASLATSVLERVRLKELRASFETYSTGGENLDRTALPYGFDHMESFFVGAEARPTDELTAALTLSAVGHVARNPIDELFYERGRELIVTDASGDEFSFPSVKVYQASVAWDAPLFRLDGYYRAGHGHWGYEGDHFGLYRDAYYGDSADIYDAPVPNGMELAGKGALEGLKLAFGPEVWWGANPLLLAKYRRDLGGAAVTAVWEEDLAQQLPTTGPSGQDTRRMTRKVALAIETTLPGGFGLALGGLWAYGNTVGDTFKDVQGSGASTELVFDEIRWADTFGAKAKLTWEGGPLHWYAQGAYMGLMAEGGPTATTTFTGWSLRDSGSGNQVNALTGLAWNVGLFQIAPHVLWQKPLVGPMPEGQVARNRIDDLFAVLENRETVGGELMLSFDPTPATWMWQWDNDVREDAAFAASLDLVYRHHPTNRDGYIAIGEGGAIIKFTSSPPARDLWEARARVVMNPAADLRVVVHGWAGTAEPRGSDARLVHRYGGDFRVAWGRAALAGHVKYGDYGPYDYYRDFNLTFPLQLMGDLSYALQAPRWFGLPQTKVGVRGTLRYLDLYSPRFEADPAEPDRWGHEYELRTYLQVAM